MNNQVFADARNVVSGKDGQIFATTSKGKQVLLGEVTDFQATIHVSNKEYQPIGSALSFAVNTGYSMELTMNEVVVRDDVLMMELLNEVSLGYMPSFDFQGKIARRDGSAHRQVFRNCIPDKSVDLLNITPGDIMDRKWTFRVNAAPELIEGLER